ncbi:hypothetical protein OTK49_21100 [Vibrio coralliirubri]|uniref:hypothetical protein n=1 Tax=Vibrio coralliirubri TaxID=1516159 RepID=UPI0022836220|nr:hypothetical protein [Vibrio coralliirubri]MCY9865018.1 hypothetical protein [Vibrio coralliirubri]
MTPVFLQAEFKTLAEKTKNLFKETMPEDSVKGQAALALLNELEAVIASVQQEHVNKPVVRTIVVKTLKRPDGDQTNEFGLDLRPDIKDKTFTVEYTMSHDQVDHNLLGKMNMQIRNGFTSGMSTVEPDNEVDQCDYCGCEFEDIPCTTTMHWRVIDTVVHNQEEE